MIDQTQAQLISENLYDSDRLAKIMVDHMTNEKGEILARVWENPGFQEIYDYKGVLRQRQRLRRKAEQVFNQLNAETKLFQKTYYNPALLAEDEVTLRETFIRLNESNENTLKYARVAFFGAYWPLTYVLSRQFRAPTVFAWTALYYFGFYRYGAVNWINCNLQSSLNQAAAPLAVKYGIRKPDEYLK